MPLTLPMPSALLICFGGKYGHNAISLLFYGDIDVSQFSTPNFLTSSMPGPYALEPSFLVPMSLIFLAFRLHRSGGSPTIFPARNSTWRRAPGARWPGARRWAPWSRRRCLWSASLTARSFAANASTAGILVFVHSMHLSVNEGLGSSWTFSTSN